MVEVTFCGSFAGALRSLRHEHHDDRVGDVLEIDELYLELGDLTKGVFSDNRLEQLHSFFSDEWISETGDALFAPKVLKKPKRIVNKVKKAAKDGEDIRIWYSLSADQYCAFLYLVHELEGIDAHISYICLQNDSVYPDEGVWGMGLLEPKMIPAFFAAEQQLTEEARRHFAAEWKRLSSEPWPLRTFSEGAVVGVPESFYDSVMEYFIPEDKEFLNIPAAGNRHSGKMETAKPGRRNRKPGEVETAVPVDGNRLRRSRAC